MGNGVSEKNGPAKEYPEFEKIEGMYPEFKNNIKECIDSANGELRFANVVGGSFAVNIRKAQMLYDFDNLIQESGFGKHAMIGEGLRQYGNQQKRSTWARTVFIAAATGLCTYLYMDNKNHSPAVQQTTTVKTVAQPK